MAIVQRLETELSLKGAENEAFALSSLMPIRDALITRGLLPGGALTRESAWIHIETWTYRIPFSLREDAFERYELYAPYVLGEGEVVLNGDAVCAFSTGELRADLTALIREENILEVTFHPAIPPHPTAPFERGILGGALLRGSNFITLESVSLDTGESGASANIRLRAHVAGRYDFVYAANGEKYAFSEKLRATVQTFSHTIPAAPGTDIKLAIERGGVACDEWVFHSAHIGPHSPWFAIDAQALLSGDVDAALARNLCLPAVFAEVPSLLSGAIDGIVLKGGESTGLAPSGNLDAALMRGARVRIPRLDAHSADYLRIAARAKLPHAFICTTDAHLLPNETQVFPVYFAGDARAKYPLSVSAVAYDAAGRALASCAFTAMGERIEKLGELRMNIPETLSHLIIRVTTTGFVTGESAIHDHIFSSGKAPGPAQLLRKDGRIKNESAHFAIVCVFGTYAYHGALLPGESVPAGESDEVKSINGEIREE